MKKWLKVFIILLLALGLAACGSNDATEESDKKEEAKETGKLVVGATNVPHAEILEQAKPILEEKGIDLQIKVFQDYALPNIALDDKSLDANYYQHIPFFERQIEEHGYDFVNAGGIHIEPIGIYSKKYESIEELPEGAEILLSSSVADHGRVLALLEKEGLVKIKEGVDPTKANIEDIKENPKNFQFKYEYEASLLPQAFNNGEGDAVVINSNYALDVDLNPLEDSIAIEESDSPYVNIIAVRNGDENDKRIKTLIEVLHSEEIQEFMLNQWGGSVVPVTE